MLGKNQLKYCLRESQKYNPKLHRQDAGHLIC